MLATNLYRVLGKKTTSEAFSNKEDFDVEQENKIFAEEVKDYSQKQVINLDKDFNFNDFLNGAKNAFRLIVVAYKTGTLKDIQDLLSKEVYELFENSMQNNNNISNKFNITSVKASIQNIEVIKKFVKIKVEFFSNQEAISKEKPERQKDVRDVWTFEKDMEKNSPIWTLVEVSTE